jgi:hypothetical protein
MPFELVVEGLTPPLPPVQEMAVEGGLLLVEPQQDGTATVVRLISGDPRDYLDPRFQPGARIRRR